MIPLPAPSSSAPSADAAVAVRRSSVAPGRGDAAMMMALGVSSGRSTTIRVTSHLSIQFLTGLDRVSYSFILFMPGTFVYVPGLSRGGGTGQLRDFVIFSVRQKQKRKMKPSSTIPKVLRAGGGESSRVIILF